VIFAVGRQATFPTILLYAMLGAIGWLTYARVLGRLGYLLMFTKGFESEEKEEEKPKPKKKKVLPEPDELAEPPSRVQPSEMEPMTGGIDGPVTGYSVNWGAEPENKPIPSKKQPKSKKPKPRWENGEPVVQADPWEGEIPLELPVIKRPIEEEEDDLAFADLDGDKLIRVREAEGASIAAAEKNHRFVRPEPKESEIQLYSKHRRGEEPKQAFEASLLGFLGQAVIVRASMTLFIGMLVFAAATQMLRALKPGGGGLG
jgi:hypothetical protein